MKIFSKLDAIAVKDTRPVLFQQIVGIHVMYTLDQINKRERKMKLSTRTAVVLFGAFASGIILCTS